MSEKAEKVWIVVRKDGGYVWGTIRQRRKDAIWELEYVKAPSSHEDRRTAWQEARKLGYRCVKATLTWEE